MNRETIIRHLKAKGRLDCLIAGVLMFILVAILLKTGGPLDYMNIGEPYTIEGVLEDCYIKESSGSKYDTSTLRIIVDGGEYTIWDSYMGMSREQFRETMLNCRGGDVRLQCVDSPGYDRHVIGFSLGFHQFIRPEEAMELRRQNSKELGIIALLFGLAGVFCLVFAAGLLPAPGYKKKTG